MQDVADMGRRAAGVLAALGWLALEVGCGGFRAEDEATGTTAPPTSSSSSSSSSSDDAHDSPGDVSTSTEAPSRPVPPPFELPPGCGDGLVVPGQYDCFVPVAIHWPGLMAPVPLGEGHDVDADGREEIAYAESYKPQLLSYDDVHGFVLGPGASTTLGSHIEGFSWRWDWDGDGKQDLTSFPTASNAAVAVNTSFGKDNPGTWVVVHRWDELLANSGRAIPIDIDGDGQLEVLVSHRLMPEWENSPTEITVRRRVGNTWHLDGPSFPYGGCGALAFHAFGDVDGDGDDDLVIADDTFVCDPHPSQYDPAWHVVGVFLVDAAAGELQLAGWFPTGFVSNQTWFELADADDDGVLDLVMNFEAPDRVTAGFMRGRGDGSFDEGVLVPLDDAASPLGLQSRGDLDGDGDSEWLARGRGPGDTVHLYVLEAPLAQAPVKPFVTFEDPLAAYSYALDNRHAVDLNGDGVDDMFLNRSIPFVQGTYARYVMVSAP